MKSNYDSVKEKVKDLTEKLEKGIMDIFSSGVYEEYLKSMSKFHRYSVNNQMLIFLQKPESTLVAGYKTWQKEFNRFVKKGEKGLSILAPTSKKIFLKKEVEDLSAEGGKRTVVEEKKITTYRPVQVFDVSQTDGDPLPQMGVEELKGNVNDYQSIFDSLLMLSPVPVGFEEITTGSKGYFSPIEKRIALKKGMEEVQNIKTLIHEITHSILHNEEKMKEKSKDRYTKEVEAESTAYVVCNYFGIDTSDYSFAYVTGWSSGKELTELKDSLDTIRETASDIIDKLTELLSNKNAQVA